MNKLLTCFSTFFILLVFYGISMANEAFITLPSGLEYKDLRAGSGLEAQLGATAAIHFVGWLSDKGRMGKEIYNSRKERQPVSFQVGTDKVMQGWNEGVIGMKPGGMRMLRIPPNLGYREKAVDDVVPPNSHLIFILELLELK